MSDEEIPPPSAESLLAAAIVAAGAKGRNESNYDWKLRVEANIGLVSEVFQPRSKQALLAARLANPDKVFTTHFGGYEIEESSTRAVVKFVDEDGKPQMTGKAGKEKQETVRTERTDGPAGKRMVELLDSLKFGARIAVMIFMDQINDETKVRVLLHVQPIGKPKDGVTGPTSAPTRTASTPQPDDAPPPPDDDRPQRPRRGPDDEVNSPQVLRAVAGAKAKLGDYRWNIVKQEVARKGGIDVEGLSWIDYETHVKPVARLVFETVPETEEPF